MLRNVQIIDHPLVHHKLSFLRDRSLPIVEFRAIVRELSVLLAYEATKELSLKEKRITLPDGTICVAKKLEDDTLCFMPILRAGNALLAGMLDFVPTASVGHIVVQRHHSTLEAQEYYFKAPDKLEKKLCIVLDPMLATGHSAIAAIHRIKKAGVKELIFACLVAAPEGVKALSEAHPDVRIITCSIDEGLDQKSYIVPGLGDAGDRFYGT
ncbi:uracil phosphoribosyltransferase [Aristophania vespae]|uniref:Uracil phosphoribosyltransferase n=1 Tax=Aristophania vespae TaxID=2697033 RepID=A0A6P1NEM8_9PROT|nr:uracil phosphoribosyltransferase [Aristophania vespae]QHI95863.1 uracil phosphoribosyltransferase [Aristophania vespae]UMM63587.1 Uracil phosphoribosyltransferase [Aristophania vespae]